MLRGKVAIVTGSTSGIGVGMAKAFAAEGADVVLNGFGEAPVLEQLRKDIAKEHGVKVTLSGDDQRGRIHTAEGEGARLIDRGCGGSCPRRF